MKNKILLLLILIFCLTSCSGMNKKRSEKSDEFLIEKKNPLVMPPGISELPTPDDKNVLDVAENEFKETLKSKKKDNKNLETSSDGSLQDSIMKKIEQ